MSGIDPSYLQYRHRRYGMDHDRYDWSILPRRKKIIWPNDARIALWLVPALEWFPIDMKGKPFKPPGAMQTAYPDLRHYTLRDYGNRVGIWRLFKLFDRLGIRATAAMNAAVAMRHPALVKACLERGWEIAAGGLDMDHLHYEGLPVEEERKTIEMTLAILREATGGRIKGWFSPAKSQSFATLDLLAAAGVSYCGDWCNDDMPYRMRTKSGEILAMPHPCDIDDYQILIQNHHDDDEFRDQLCDHFDLLYREAATQGGRVMAIALHPWIIGQPYRIGALEAALEHMLRHRGVWCATGAEIAEAWRSQA
jgi:peptidoglycan/xylan/chitin deacetylase (PgdA/CDA1 family)